MGGALGWFVVALAGVAGAPPAERAKAQITYTVRMVEAQGVDWREGVFNRLKPVTRQGAATVWTVPRDAAKQLLEEFSKSPDAKILQAPKVTASSGVPPTIQCRRNRPVVTPGGLERTGPGHRDRVRKHSRGLAHDHGRAQARPGDSRPGRLRGHRRSGRSTT